MALVGHDWYIIDRMASKRYYNYVLIVAINCEVRLRIISKKLYTKQRDLNSHNKYKSIIFTGDACTQNKK